ncbi:MAG: response regulator [Lentisphaerales bacterium]|jgi:DNA-binding NtrC family response regulator|nr:MAG: response regulator [Lentisphaerales bacterium]
MARILLVDDENCILRTMALVLESEGHSTVCVLNGEEAISQLDSHEFDLVLTDIRMAPMDGVELLTELKKVKPEMPVIVVSAYGSDATAAQCAELGAFEYIKKPFDVGKVLNAVGRALASSRS